MIGYVFYGTIGETLIAYRVKAPVASLPAFGGHDEWVCDVICIRGHEVTYTEEVYSEYFLTYIATEAP